MDKFLVDAIERVAGTTAPLNDLARIYAVARLGEPPANALAGFEDAFRGMSFLGCLHHRFPVAAESVQRDYQCCRDYRLGYGIGNYLSQIKAKWMVRAFEKDSMNPHQTELWLNGHGAASSRKKLIQDGYHVELDRAPTKTAP